MFPLILALVLAHCATEVANQPNDSGLAIELPALPIYPKDGSIPATFKNRFVFLDQQANQFIVAFEPIKGSSARSIAQRTSLATGVCPSLTAAFKKNETGAIDYEYRAANLAGARQELWTWVLPLAFREPVRITRAPLGWYGAETNPDETIQANAFEVMTYSLSKDRIQQLQASMIRRKVDWYARSVDGIAPRQAQGPYRITSKARPGIITAYFQGSSLFSANSSWPPEVLGQVLTLNWTENNSVSLLTMGPKFDPGVKRSTIANDYLTVINRAIKQKRLRPSAFLAETMKQLSEGAIDSGIHPASQPSTPLERQILSSLELSLSQH
jgi:hypothetical protein